MIALPGSFVATVFVWAALCGLVALAALVLNERLRSVPAFASMLRSLSGPAASLHPRQPILALRTGH